MTPAEIRSRHTQIDSELRTEAITAMLAHTATRKLLWWLLEQGNAFGNPNPFSTDPLAMSFNCGIMSVGKAIFEEIASADPEALMTLMKEHEDERRTRNDELARAESGRDHAAGDGWYDRGTSVDVGDRGD